MWVTSANNIQSVFITEELNFKKSNIWSKVIIECDNLSFYYFFFARINSSFFRSGNVQLSLNIRKRVLLAGQSRLASAFACNSTLLSPKYIFHFINAFLFPFIFCNFYHNTYYFISHNIKNISMQILISKEKLSWENLRQAQSFDVKALFLRFCVLLSRQLSENLKVTGFYHG